MNDVAEWDWLSEKAAHGYVICNGNINAAIREFKEKTAKSGILREVRRKRWALSKTERRREKSRIARRRDERSRRRQQSHV